MSGDEKGRRAGGRATRAVVDDTGLGEDPLADPEADPLLQAFYQRDERPAVRRQARAEEQARATEPTSRTPKSRTPPAREAASAEPRPEAGSAPARRRASSETEPRRRPLRDGQTYRLVTFSFYEEDVERLDELLAEARKRGHRRTSRSQIVRLALRQVDLDDLPDPI